jgi:hypothetical protein
MGVQEMGKPAADYTEAEFIASVGKIGFPTRDCHNTVSDQEMVRTLLNAVPIRYGGRYDPQDSARQLTGDLRFRLLSGAIWILPLMRA